MKIRGTFNNWSSTEMTEIENNVYCFIIKSSEKRLISFKFDRRGDWKENYGSDKSSETSVANVEPIHELVRNGKNILHLFERNTEYIIRFAENKYEIKKQQYYSIRGTMNNWGTLRPHYSEGNMYHYQLTLNPGINKFKIDKFEN